MLDKLEMHQAPEKVEAGSKDLYQPNKKETKAIKLVMKKFDEYKAYRSKYDGDWMEHYEMFRGKQWQEARPSYRHSEVINLIFRDIQSVVPILTDTKPKNSFLPVEPGDRPLADIFDKIYDFEWRKKNWSTVLTECLYDSHIYGTCYASMEHETVDGKGSAVFESKDPFYCFPDPDSHDVNKKGNGFIYAEPIRLETAKRKYRKHAKFMKADITDVLEQDKTTLGKVKFQTATDRKAPMYEAGDGPKHYNADKMVLDITLWVRDDSYSEEEKTDNEGKKIYEQKLDFPKGRKIKVVGGVLINDGEIEYIDHEKRFAPFARMQNYVLPREFYGISEIEQTKGPQRTFNKLVSFALDVLTTMGNPIWIVDTTAGIDIDGLTNRPGLVIEKTPGSEVKRQEGVQLQPYVLALIDRMQSWFSEMTGATDITHGKKPEGVSSAIAIRTVQDASHTRLRLKSRLMEGFLQDIGQMYIARVFQFYTAPQIFRISNDQESYKYFKMSIEPGKDGEKHKINIREVQEGEGQNARDGELQEFESQGEFDVVAAMGSALPFAKEERISLAMQLMKAGIVDAEEVLTAADYPNKEKVLQRMQEKEAQMMQAQQQNVQEQQAGQVELKDRETAGKMELQAQQQEAQMQQAKQQ